MKKIYSTGILLLVALVAWGQTVTGPRTIYELPANGADPVYFNLRTGSVVDVSEANTTNWDVAFKTTSVYMNSGASGPSTVGSQIVNGSFDTYTEVPESGYDVTEMYPTGSNNSWYVYNYNFGLGVGNHSITPIPNKLLLFKLADGSYVKLEMLNYYQGVPLEVPTTGDPYTGVGGYISFRYLHSATTDVSNRITKVSDLLADPSLLEGSNQFFDLASGKIIAKADSNSTKWDLAFSSTTVLVNSGTSGPDADAAQVVLSNFNDVLEAPENGYNEDDATRAIPTGSGNGWYSYSAGVISPIEDRTIVVKLANERYAKIKFQAYYNSETNAARYYTFSYEYAPSGSRALTATITEEPTTSIRYASSESLVNVFPVPSRGTELNVTWPSELSVQKVKISNALGANVYTREVAASQTEVSLTGLQLAKGIFYVTLEGANAVETKKIIVE
jgi:hypothetical protein